MRKLYCHKNCSKLDNGRIIEYNFLTIGKIYNGDLVPRLLDPVTYKPLKDSYINIHSFLLSSLFSFIALRSF